MVMDASWIVSGFLLLICAGLTTAQHDYTNEQITLTNVTARSFILEWKQVSLNDTDSGLQYGYQIQYWMLGRSQDAVTLNVAYDTSLTTVSRTLSSLSPNSQYKVTLTPYTRRDGGVIRMGTSYPEQDVTTTCGEDISMRLTPYSRLSVRTIEVTYKLPNETGSCNNNITSVSLALSIVGSDGRRVYEADKVGDTFNAIVTVSATYSLTLTMVDDDGFERVVGPREILVPSYSPTQAPPPPTSPPTTPAPHVKSILTDRTTVIAVIVVVTILGMAAILGLITLSVLRHIRKKDPATITEETAKA